MTKLSVVAAMALALGGCGSGDSGSPPEPIGSQLTGNWIATVGSCGIGVNFGPGDAFSENFACPNAAGTGVNLEENLGTYTADAANIYVTLAKSTCADAQPSFYDPYSLSGNSLTLAEASSIILLAPNTSTGGSGLGTLGCFRNGVFTPSPLSPL